MAYIFSPVLNAFRHLRFIHLERLLQARVSFAVLNAFRHLRFIHRQSDKMLVRQSECSTPFGISDSFTAEVVRTLANVVCAQRLSASQIHSQPQRRMTLSVDTLCSTPFGISDSFTRGQRRSPTYHLAVLNAFRHLRFIHPQ